MNQTPSALPVAQKPRKPASPSFKAHRAQTTWQIYLPLGIACLAMLGLLAGVIFTAAAPGPDTTRLSLWSDASLIFMMAPVLVVCFFFVVLTIGLVYGMARLLGVLPPYTMLAQSYVAYGASLVRYWCDRVVDPVIRVRGFLAGLQAAWIKIKKDI